MAKFCCNIVMVINIGIHDSDKKLFMSQCFQEKEYQYFWCFIIHTNAYIFNR